MNESDGTNGELSIVGLNFNERLFLTKDLFNPLAEQYFLIMALADCSVNGNLKIIHACC